jgi:hypothetical protein
MRIGGAGEKEGGGGGAPTRSRVAGDSRITTPRGRQARPAANVEGPRARRTWTSQRGKPAPAPPPPRTMPGTASGARPGPAPPPPKTTRADAGTRARVVAADCGRTPGWPLIAGGRRGGR